MNATSVAPYDMATFLGSTSFIDQAAIALPPSYSFPSSTATTTATGTATATTSTATSTVSASCVHPTSGTVPPAGAVIVSSGGSVNGSFSNITLALASMPTDGSCQILFIYPGTYSEQVTVSRSGKTIVMGYTTANVGQTYSGNQVTISYARGLSVSPLPTGHSDAETAVISTAGTGVSFYNVDFVNPSNSDGAISSWVTLAGSVYGTQMGFYGVSMIGWQDTLLTGATAGYHYFESSYIEGAIDFGKSP